MSLSPEALMQEWNSLLSLPQFDPSDLDPTALDRHRVALAQLASLNNVGVTAFDMYRREHVFVSYNFQDLFGYDLSAIAREGNDYFDSRVHPEDHLTLLHTAIAIMKLYYSLPLEERTHFKLINEYRILNAQGEYVRIIEQHQALELDRQGNVWLSMGVMDISPDQDPNTGVRSRVMNYKTGRILRPEEWQSQPKAALAPVLSARELEVLALIQEGKISKEISDQLCISVHTVNTHRQRILEKLNADNSLEAVAFAKRLGLFG